MIDWPIIGFWHPNQPVIGQCGSMPWDWRPWRTYVVLPHGQSEGDDGWARSRSRLDLWERSP